jgi:hypothetical protein
MREGRGGPAAASGAASAAEGVRASLYAFQQEGQYQMRLTFPMAMRVRTHRHPKRPLISVCTVSVCGAVVLQLTHWRALPSCSSMANFFFVARGLNKTAGWA